MLLLSPSTQHHQFTPRVRLLMIRFTPPDSLFWCEGDDVDVCFHSLDCGLKVVQVNIQARERFALSTLRVIPITKVTTDNFRINHAARSVCSGLCRAASRSRVTDETVSIRQCFLFLLQLCKHQFISKVETLRRSVVIVLIGITCIVLSAKLSQAQSFT